MKFNMGCGTNILAGYKNVDKYITAEKVSYADLEFAPWPWDDNCAEEVIFNHSLEHMGQLTQKFKIVIQQLYRICKNGAVVKIAVPHPRHDHFLGDPTHVRVITPLVLSLLSKKNCEEWKRTKAANSQLATYWGVDFELMKVEYIPDVEFLKQTGILKEKNIDDALKYAEKYVPNSIAEIKMELKVIK